MIKYEFAKKIKSCIVENESLGGLTYGLLYSNFLPSAVSVFDTEDEYLLHQNMKELTYYDTFLYNKPEFKDVDLYAFNINQAGNTDYLRQYNIAFDIVKKTNFKNYFICINSTAQNPIGGETKFKPMINTFSDKNYYVHAVRMYYRSYGGSEFRVNTYLIATEHPTESFYDKKDKTNLGEPATINIIETLKKRNGYPEYWKLDLLDDDGSFNEQIKKLENCVLPTLVKKAADIIFILDD